jgi:hypothetical protein
MQQIAWFVLDDGYPIDMATKRRLHGPTLYLILWVGGARTKQTFQHVDVM